MAKIRLSNTGKFVLVDATIWETLRHLLWWEHHSGYAITKIYGKHIPMHRLVLMAPEGVCVDHINRNRKDNRLRNLRLCTKQENTYNASRAKNNSTGYKGVHFHRKNRNFVAYIGKLPRKHLGSFRTAKEAAKMYNKAALERFGSMANLNEV